MITKTDLQLQFAIENDIPMLIIPNSFVPASSYQAESRFFRKVDCKADIDYVCLWCNSYGDIISHTECYDQLKKAIRNLFNWCR